jgi:hypothetical protein
VFDTAKASWDEQNELAARIKITDSLRARRWGEAKDKLDIYIEKNTSFVARVQRDIDAGLAGDERVGKITTPGSAATSPSSAGPGKPEVSKFVHDGLEGDTFGDAGASSDVLDPLFCDIEITRIFDFIGVGLINLIE